MNLRSIVVLLALLAAVACSEPLESTDWTIPVPAGTPIIEHPAVSIGEREGKRIELVRDLVIGSRGEDPNYLFYFDQTWKALAVDDDGRMYVGDGGNNRVQVFDQQGQHLRTLGRPGFGPGELQSAPFLIAIAGALGFLRLGGTSSGDLLAAYSLRYGDEAWRQIVRIARLAGGRRRSSNTCSKWTRRCRRKPGPDESRLAGP